MSHSSDDDRGLIMDEILKQVGNLSSRVKDLEYLNTAYGAWTGKNKGEKDSLMYAYGKSSTTPLLQRL